MEMDANNSWKRGQKGEWRMSEDKRLPFEKKYKNENK